MQSGFDHEHAEPGYVPVVLSREERERLRRLRRQLMRIWAAPTHDHRAEAETLRRIKALLGR